MSSILRSRAFSATIWGTPNAVLLASSVVLCLFVSGTQIPAAEAASEPRSSWGDAVHLLLGEAEAGTSEVLQRLHFKSANSKDGHDRADSAAADQSKATDASKQDLLAEDKRNDKTLHRKLHGAWLKGLDDGRRARKLAQAPGSVRIFSASSACRSVTCNGVCCDALFTYGSSMDTPCTQPAPTCSASGQCQSQPQLDANVCIGMRFGFQSYPGNAAAINTAGQLGFSCPASASSACGYLNTYSYDMTPCTQGACIPTTTGGLNCIPLVQGLDKFGCVVAVQTFTGAQANVGGTAALIG